MAALGYLWSTRVGAHLYNLTHAAPLPAVLAGIGIWQHQSLVLAIALIWLAHIGLDRAMNYRLKHDTDSCHAHLGRQGPPAPRLDGPKLSNTMPGWAATRDGNVADPSRSGR